jgi:ATP-dependent DNA helicase RecQ
VADVERVTNWLKSYGISAEAYHAGDDSKMDREALEKALLGNELKALVATVALGMGFDKPDLSFVVHFQRPGSVVAYYQQVGRAGRAVDRAMGSC